MTTILQDMFSNADEAQLIDRLDLYKAANAASAAETEKGLVKVDFIPDSETGREFKILRKAPAGYSDVAEQLGFLSGTINKAAGAGGSFDADFMAALDNVTRYITKDWTPTSPVAGNMFPYDLIPLARQLWPRDTPLRNTTPRGDGQGGAKEFIRLLSVSNAGVPGGAANMSIGFNSMTQTSNWGSAPVVLNRPPKISVTGDRKSVLYMELGVSDAVQFVSYFKGLGFDNQRTLSRTAALWAHLLGEERMQLFGRGTAAGYLGSVTAPTGVTAVGSGSGTIPDATYFVYVAALTGEGYSAVSTVASTGALATGGLNTNTNNRPGEPTGALAYGVWIGTATGIANAKFQGNFPGKPIVLTTYNATGAVTAGTDTSALATSFDGYLTLSSDPTQAGYFKRINAKWNTTTPGQEIDDMLTNMFVSYGARPDELWFDGVSRARLGQLMRTGGSTGAAYRTTIVTGTTNGQMGVTVTGVANPQTGEMLDALTHRFMPPGICWARSTGVPYPDARISAPSTMFNVQDYMAIEWPLFQMSYDVSTYQIGTLVHQAPMLYGMLVGIQP